MFHRIIFLLLLIVSILSVYISPNYFPFIINCSKSLCNFNRCAVCFQSLMNIACRSSQNAMRIPPETLLKITVYSMGTSSRPLFLFNVYFSSHKWIWMKSNIVSKGSLIPCLSSRRVSSLQVLHTVSTSRWRAGRWIGFPESVFVYGYSNYMV